MRGEPITACPYGDPRQPYKGGSVTRQRREYWLRGWKSWAVVNSETGDVRCTISDREEAEDEARRLNDADME